MNQVGFYCKYTWADETCLAFGLSDLARQLGLSTTWMCNQAKDLPLHEVWDHHVQSQANGKSFCEWCSKLSHITWFEHQPKLLSEATRQGVRNILVVTNDRDFHSTDFADYDQVLFPNLALSCGWGETTNSRVVPWRVYFPGRRQIVEDRRFRVYLPFSSRAADSYGPRLFYSLHILLSNHPEVDLTLAFARNWNRPSLNALRDLASHHKKRVSLRRKPTYHLRTEGYLTHNLVIAAGYDDYLGLVALEAASLGLPIVALDTPVIRNVIADYPACSLIPCKVVAGRLGIHCRPDPSPSDLVQGLSAAVSSKPKDSQTFDKQQFVSFWMGEWGLT